MLHNIVKRSGCHKIGERWEIISRVRQALVIADANELGAELIWQSTKYFTRGYLDIHETTGRALSRGECIDLGRVQNRREAIS